MPYDKSDPYQKALALWCNNKFIFKACPDFDEYEGARRQGATASRKLVKDGNIELEVKKNDGATNLRCD